MTFEFHPYIGITGFTQREQVQQVLRALDELPSMHKRALMVGVLASSKSMQGEATRYPGRYPAIDEIDKIFMPHERALNLIHYATDDQSTLLEQLKELMLFGGPFLHGFQLNVKWPDPSVLEAVVQTGYGIVLQIGGGALKECRNDPQEVARRLQEYRTAVTSILIDPSSGRGVDFDPLEIIAYLQAIARTTPDIGLGFAGGLSPDNLDRIVMVLDSFPYASIDVEGKLRDSEDRLMLSEAVRYMRNAQHVCSTALATGSYRARI